MPATTTSATISPTITPTATSSIDELAAATPASRNRAIDAYRAVAMLAVALGHWLVIAVAVDDETGDVVARNALEVAPQFSVLTWLFQVMPLFFVVGGYASSRSLRAHRRRNGTDADWLVQRLRRLIAPTAALAATWLGVLAVAAVLGVGGLAAAGMVGAAIPLWFLANYTIDTALAPKMSTSLDRSRTGTVLGLSSVFLTVEVLHRGAGVPWVEHVNWVVGWLLFQVVGMIWSDLDGRNRMPSTRRLLTAAAVLWAIALGAVALGPWPITMIHVAGIAPSPTHPPSIGLVLFGLAQVTTAIAAAPMIGRWLANRRRAWSLVVAVNGVSMSVYLWHFTAAVAASAIFSPAGLLPTAEIGTAGWWLQKTPLIVASALLLVPIVAVVARFERRALLADPVPWRRHPLLVVVAAIAVSTSLKVWSLGNVAAATAGAAGIVAVTVALRPRARDRADEIGRRPGTASQSRYSTPGSTQSIS